MGVGGPSEKMLATALPGLLLLLEGMCCCYKCNDTVSDQLIRQHQAALPCRMLSARLVSTTQQASAGLSRPQRAEHWAMQCL